MKTKLKAFTLLETLIATILTSLLLLLGNNVLTYSYKQFFQSTNQNRFVSNIISLHATLNKLVNESKLITSEGTTLTFESDKAPTTLYFENQYILIKNRETTDSLLSKFNVKITNLQFIAVNDTKLLESFSVILSVDRITRTLNFKKQYSKAFLFTLLNATKNS